MGEYSITYRRLCQRLSINFLYLFLLLSQVHKYRGFTPSYRLSSDNLLSIFTGDIYLPLVKVRKRQERISRLLYPLTSYCPCPLKVFCPGDREVLLTIPPVPMDPLTCTRLRRVPPSQSSTHAREHPPACLLIKSKVPTALQGQLTWTFRWQKYYACIVASFVSSIKSA